MQSIFKSKFFLGLVVIIIIIGLVSMFAVDTSNSKPAEVLSPQGYPDGTTVEVWENAPPEFPAGVILENKKIDRSDIVVSAGGKRQVTVVYTSDKPMLDVVNLYKYSLNQAGWSLVVNAASEKVATIVASKVEERLIITLTPEEAGAVVTLQYEK